MKYKKWKERDLIAVLRKTVITRDTWDKGTISWDALIHMHSGDQYIGDFTKDSGLPPEDDPDLNKKWDMNILGHNYRFYKLSGCTYTKDGETQTYWQSRDDNAPSLQHNSLKEIDEWIQGRQGSISSANEQYQKLDELRKKLEDPIEKEAVGRGVEHAEEKSKCLDEYNRCCRAIQQEKFVADGIDSLVQNITELYPCLTEKEWDEWVKDYPVPYKLWTTMMDVTSSQPSSRI